MGPDRDTVTVRRVLFEFYPHRTIKQKGANVFRVSIATLLRRNYA